jgi:urease accessory protein
MPDALVEYLPDPIILFPNSRLGSSLDVSLCQGASLVLGESFLLHDPSGNGALPSMLESCVSVRFSNGRLIARDRMRILGDDWCRVGRGALYKWNCHGFMMVVTAAVPSVNLCQEIRSALSPIAEIYAGASSLSKDRGVCVRFLAEGAVPLKNAMTAAWKASRRLLCGAEPRPRRK